MNAMVYEHLIDFMKISYGNPSVESEGSFEGLGISSVNVIVKRRENDSLCSACKNDKLTPKVGCILVYFLEGFPLHQREMMPRLFPLPACSSTTQESTGSNTLCRQILLLSIYKFLDLPKQLSKECYDSVLYITALQLIMYQKKGRI